MTTLKLITDCTEDWSTCFVPTVPHLVAIRSSRFKHATNAIPNTIQLCTSPAGDITDTRFRDLPAWANARLHQQIDVPTLAKVVAMTPRTFARQFELHFRTTPARWVQSLRVDREAGAEGEIKLRGTVAHEQRSRLKLEGVQLMGKRVNMELFEHSIKTWEAYR